MTQSAKGCSWQLSLVSYLATAGTLTFSIAFPFANSVFAQSAITADDSLGDERSQVIENYLGNPTEALTGGASRNNNLFHSFLEFNVKENRSAVFLSPSNIQNILVRVTGSNRSEILGRLGISGSNANLFLINPNGIIFGPNATLNLGGSFVASTASGIKFANSTVFSATASQTIPLLTVSVPIGLQFGGTVGEIKIDRQSFLEVQTGKTLALVGGNVSLDGGFLVAPSGQIALGGIIGAGTIGLNLDSNTQPLSFPKDVVSADISISNGAIVFVSDEGSGDIQLQGRHITLTDGSQVFAQTGSQNGRGISIQAEQLTIQGGSQVSVSTFGQGAGGNLAVKATDFVQVIGTDVNGNPSALFADTYGEGAAGNLIIETGRLIVKNGAQVAAGARKDSQGTGGTLKVIASDFVKLSGTSLFGFNSGLFAETEGSGDAGSLTIDTRQLIVQDGAQVVAGTRPDSQGKGGTLTVRASDSVELSGTTSNSQDTSGLFARSRGSGDAGSVSITTGRLIVRDQAQVTVAALGSGNAGNLDITAREIRLDRQGKLLANTTSGNGGNINLQLQNLLLLRNMSQISATAGTEVAGGGNGGNITINTPNGFIVAVPNENSDISANAFTGSGGKVEITAYGVFGIEPRSREDLEKLLGTNDPTKLDPQKLPTNDITAISQANPTLNGVVKINTPDIDLNEGLINLPTQPVELKVAQVCKAGAGRNQNSFTVTGRGGVPSSPTEPLSADAVLADWITLDKVSATPSNTPVTQNYTKPNPETIVEATGWEINAKGEIVLTATVPNVTHHNSWQKSADCSALPASS
jgi:filamentous hemagglutinin family protein